MPKVPLRKKTRKLKKSRFIEKEWKTYVCWETNSSAHIPKPCIAYSLRQQACVWNWRCADLWFDKFLAAKHPHQRQRGVLQGGTSGTATLPQITRFTSLSGSLWFFGTLSFGTASGPAASWFWDLTTGATCSDQVVTKSDAIFPLSYAVLPQKKQKEKSWSSWKGEIPKSCGRFVADLASERSFRMSRY